MTNTYITNINNEIPEILIEITVHGCSGERPDGWISDVPASVRGLFKKVLHSFLEDFGPVMDSLTMIDENGWTTKKRDRAIRALWLGDKNTQDELVRIFGPSVKTSDRRRAVKKVVFDPELSRDECPEPTPIAAEKKVTLSEIVENVDFNRRLDIRVAAWKAVYWNELISK